MAKGGRKTPDPSAMLAAEATVRAATISRDGTIRAARMNAAAAVVVALIAGSAMVINTSVQGYYSVARVQAGQIPNLEDYGWFAYTPF